MNWKANISLSLKYWRKYKVSMNELRIKTKYEYALFFDVVPVNLTSITSQKILSSI